MKQTSKDLVATSGVLGAAIVVGGLVIRFTRQEFGPVHDASSRVLVQLLTYAALATVFTIGYAVIAWVYSRASAGERLGDVITRTFQRFQGKVTSRPRTISAWTY